MTDSELPYVDLLTRVGEINRCPGGKHTIQRIARRLGVGPDTQVLEIGSNTGFTSMELVKITGCSIVGIDVSESAVAAARENADKLAANLAERIVFQVADARNLPFQDSHFNLIICGGANTFIKGREQAFAEYRRVLRPYGFISITNLFYRTPPSADLTAELMNILGFEIPAYGLSDWLRILTPSGWEFYDVSTTELAARPSHVIDQYVDELCGSTLSTATAAEREAITRQWRRVMHVFNRNHAHLSFLELLLRRDDSAEQPELFLRAGQFDPFYEFAFTEQGSA